MSKKERLLLPEGNNGHEKRFLVALIGGMDRLKNHYRSEAGKSGIELRVYNRSEANIGSKIRNLDAIVIFTNKVSHYAKGEVMNTARSNNIPVLMCHSSGTCALRGCIARLLNTSLSSAL